MSTVIWICSTLMLQIHPTKSLDTITHKILLHNFDEVYQTKLFTFGKGRNALFFLHLRKKKLVVSLEKSTMNYYFQLWFCFFLLNICYAS